MIIGYHRAGCSCLWTGPMLAYRVSKRIPQGSGSRQLDSGFPRRNIKPHCCRSLYGKGRHSESRQTNDGDTSYEKWYMTTTVTIKMLRVVLDRAHRKLPSKSEVYRSSIHHTGPTTRSCSKTSRWVDYNSRPRGFRSLEEYS